MPEIRMPPELVCLVVPPRRSQHQQVLCLRLPAGIHLPSSSFPATQDPWCLILTTTWWVSTTVAAGHAKTPQAHTRETPLFCPLISYLPRSTLAEPKHCPPARPTRTRQFDIVIHFCLFVCVCVCVRA